MFNKFEDVAGRVNRREPVDVVHLDFQEMFDKMPHRKMYMDSRELRAFNCHL